MLPPELEPKYDLRGTLGSGAMGTVFEAMDRRIERRVAIKVVRRPSAGDPEGEEAHARFRREAQAAGRLSHPNIVGVFDYGEDASSGWIVMELVEGESLKSRLDRGERLAVPEIVRLLEQVCAALAYSHARGVVHRDIKPGNIMLTGGPDGALGDVKIADFGIARLENSSMTQVGTMIGTPSYMAPEQLRGEMVDARADLWAVGVVLYQLLTGEKPFDGGFSAVMHKALHTDPAPPSRLSVTAPPAFDALIAQALAKRPEARFQSAAALGAAIRAALTAAPGAVAGEDATMISAAPIRAPAAPPAPPPMTVVAAPVSRRPPWALLGGGAAVVAAIGAWLLLAAPEPAVQTPPPPTSPPIAGPVARAPEPPTAPPPPATIPAPLPTAPARTDADLQRIREAEQERTRRDLEQRVADWRAAAAAAVAAEPCGLLTTTADAQSVRITGLVRRGGDATMRQVLLGRGVPAAAIAFSLHAFDGPFCGALDAIRAAQAAPETPPLAELVGQQPLAKGELLKLALAMPPAPSQLYVAYLVASGEVAHLVPGRAEPAAAKPLLGEPSGGFPGWEIDAPFGTDLVLVFASDRPIFPARRPQVEPLAGWVTALTGALRQVQAQGGRVAVRAVPVDTVERR